MKRLRRNYSMDSGSIKWLTKDESTSDAIEVDATKSNLIAAIKGATDFPNDIKLFHHSVPFLYKIAENYNLV